MDMQLWETMGAKGYIRRFRQRGYPHPLTDASYKWRIRLQNGRGLLVDVLSKLESAQEVLSYRNGKPQLRSQARVPGNIVRYERLFEPEDVQIFQLPPEPQRRCKVESLVTIYH